jgi:hypothetical protein
MNLIYKVKLSVCLCVGLLMAAGNANAQQDCGYWASQGYYSTTFWNGGGITVLGSFQERFQYVPVYCRRTDHATFGTSSSTSNSNTPSPEELARQERCRQTQNALDSKRCLEKDSSAPATDDSVRFNIGTFLGLNFNPMRPIIREWHTTMFNAPNDSVWYNYQSTIDSLNAKCAEGPGSYPVVGLALRQVCVGYVQSYFGQLGFNPGLAEYSDSSAARDAFPMREGQICVNLAAQKAVDKC